MICAIGINGLGRIGQMVLRRVVTLPDTEVVAVNDLAHLGDLAYLVKYDSVHGAFPGRKEAAGHLHAGARMVLISAPSDDVDVTLVPRLESCR